MEFLGEIVSFIVGAAAGSLITFKVTNKKNITTNPQQNDNRAAKINQKNKSGKNEIGDVNLGDKS